MGETVPVCDLGEGGSLECNDGVHCGAVSRVRDGVVGGWGEVGGGVGDPEWVGNSMVEHRARILQSTIRIPVKT